MESEIYIWVNDTRTFLVNRTWNLLVYSPHKTKVVDSNAAGVNEISGLVAKFAGTCII